MPAAARGLRRLSLAIALAAVGAAACSGRSAPVHGASASAPMRDETLAFSIVEGRTENHFYRRGPVAAHLLATSGPAPRLLVAFPAGNSGAGLWFDDAFDLAVRGSLAGVERRDGMRGVEAVVAASAPRVRVRTAVLGSVRLLRAVGHDGALKLPPNQVDPGPPVVVRRTTLDGAHHVEVRIEPIDGGSATVDGAGRVVVTAAPGKSEAAFRLSALADDEPLTPVSARDIVTQDAAQDPRALQALAFLSYEEKLLAGSWRFLTYFGRDTLLSTRLLMPVLQPPVIEAALRSVIERLSPTGEVAHEEDIGEWAVQRNLETGRRSSGVRTPLYDYKMVDDDFLLAPVLARYALDTDSGRLRAAGFLAHRTASGRTYAEAVRLNLDRVLAQAAPFAARPSADTLVALMPGIAVGNWRDSSDGLGNGRVPYDVNAALVPAALRAAGRLYRSPLFGADRAAADRASALARAWTQAERFFRIVVSADDARARVAAYAAEQKLDAGDALASITQPIRFSGVSLDARGAPVPIMNSDGGFVLLFVDPGPEELDAIADTVLRPFPAGLRTPVGIIVANPALAPDPALRSVFTRGSYHGTVVWSWQQALLAAGLRRQLDRRDLPAATRTRLADAEAALWKVIEATRSTSTAELWSFTTDAAGYHLVPFGQGGGHETESNAVQLWSTVYLAVKPPRAVR